VTYTGPFLVFFNRHADAPRVWTIAAPGRAWEVNVATIEIETVLTTRYQPQPARADHDGPPSAWFEGYGVVAVDAAGRATIADPE
jgi:hypothetical protein